MNINNWCPLLGGSSRARVCRWLAQALMLDTLEIMK